MESYPKDFPAPMVSNYAIHVDMGLLRSAIKTGKPRQRRKYRHMPQTFKVAFAMNIQDLDSWQIWVNGYAYDWFKMPLTSYENDPTKTCAPHTVRFISDLEINPLSPEAVAVAVVIESFEHRPEDVLP